MGVSGGSALAGETSRQAASRELQEETGIDLPPTALTPVDRFVEASALLDFYTAHEPVNAELRLQPSEVMAADWVTPDEVDRRLGVGLMAEPWVACLESIWPSLTRTLVANT